MIPKQPSKILSIVRLMAVTFLVCLSAGCSYQNTAAARAEHAAVGSRAIQVADVIYYADLLHSTVHAYDLHAKTDSLLFEDIFVRSMVYGADSVWMLAEDSVLLRFDAATQELESVYQNPDALCGALAYHDNAVYFGEQVQNEIRLLCYDIAQNTIQPFLEHGNFRGNSSLGFYQNDLYFLGDDGGGYCCSIEDPASAARVDEDRWFTIVQWSDDLLITKQSKNTGATALISLQSGQAAEDPDEILLQQYPSLTYSDQEVSLHHLEAGIFFLCNRNLSDQPASGEADGYALLYDPAAQSFQLLAELYAPNNFR